MNRGLNTTPGTSADAFGSLRYARGFVVGAVRAGLPPQFRRIPFEVPLYVHERTRFGIAQTPRGVVALLGEAVHPSHPELDLDGLAALLSARSATRQAEIDQLIGRFVVVHGSGPSDMALQTDAIAMRSVFFVNTAGGVIAGAHAKLVADLAVGRGRPMGPIPVALGCPGLATPYADVYRLPPNVELLLRSGKLRRFFPLESIPTVSIESAWELAFARAGAAVAAWAGRRSLLLSLTGGLDSRTTLAAVRDSWSQMDFFTYDRGEASQEIDRRVAADIATRLGLRYSEVDFSRDTLDAGLLEIVKDNSHGNHSRKLACAYRARFGTDRFLHVRTNLLELGRSNLFASNDRMAGLGGGPVDADSMARFYLKAGKVAPNTRVLPAFEHYVEATGFAKAAAFASAWDLYFVEHRMGAWHAGIVLESDIAFDTVIAFNSREVVRSLMGVPQGSRATSRHLLESLSRMLPELADIPINPSQYPVAPQAFE